MSWGIHRHTFFSNKWGEKLKLDVFKLDFELEYITINV